MPGRSLPSPKRYAQAVFQLALEKGDLDRWLEELRDIAGAAQDTQLVALLEAPGLRLEQKLGAIRGVLPEARVPAHNLMALLAQRRALGLARRILEEFQRMADAHQGLQRASVTSAVPLADADQERIAGLLGQLLGKQVYLKAQVDPSIVAGLVLRVGDRVIDGSTRSRLQALRRTLAEPRV
jgi:F-type H+-transporting ATPase subunit delta